MLRSRAALVALLPATSLLLASPVQAAPRSAKVYLQVPVDLSNPLATDLDRIETYGNKPLWSKSFEIPYDTLETEILQQITKVLAKQIPQGQTVETCTDPCPDVTWQLLYTPSFSFTDKNNVTLTQIGASGNSKVRAAVKFRAKAGLSGHLWAEGLVPKAMPVGFVMTKEEVDVPFSVYVEVEVTASVDVTLWPDLAAEDVVLDASLVDVSPNIEIDGTIARIGAEVGVLVGTTPLGLVSGGPLAFSSLLAVIGDKAADKVEATFEAKLTAAVQTHFNESLAKVQDAAKKMLTTAVATANAKKDKVLSTKLPGVNKSIDTLTSSLGAELAVHTVTPASGISLSGVMRMSPTKGSASMTGKVRVPARQCIYGSMMGGRIPLGYREANVALKSKVGKSCTSVMSDLSVRPYAYLGANPRTALGSAADNLSSWKADMGNVTFSGTLSKGSEYYECGYSVASMPNTAIMEMRVRRGTSSIAVETTDSRFFVQKAGPATLVLDHRFSPTTSPVVGGTDTCESGGDKPRWTPNQLKELADMLKGCPECGQLVEKNGLTIYELNDIAKVKNSALGKQLAAQISRSRRSHRSQRARAASVGSRAAAMPSSRATTSTRAKVVSPATNATKLPQGTRAMPGG